MKRLLIPLLLLPALSWAVDLDKIIATVNDEPITQTEFNRAIATATKELQSMNVPLPADPELKKQVTKKLVDETLILQIARHNNLEISDEELNMVVKDIAERNKMDIFQFKQALKNEGVDFEEYRETMRRQILLKNIQSSVANRETFVSDKEVEKYLHTVGTLPQNKEYRLASILIKSSNSSSKEEIEKVKQKTNDIVEKIKAGENFSQLAASYSDAPNALNGGELGWVSLNELPAELAGKIAQLNIGDFIGPINTPNGIIIIKVQGTKAKEVTTNLATEYNVRHILLKKTDKITDKELEDRLKAIRSEILKNKNFAAFAKINSEDLATKNKGGSLGWVTDKDVVPEFVEAMKNDKIGEISLPFKSQFGWHLVVVEDKRNIDQSQKLREDQAIATLKQQKFKTTVQKWLNDLEDSAYVQYFG